MFQIPALYCSEMNGGYENKQFELHKWPVCFTDKSIIMWKLTRDETNYGIPQRSLKGHSHFVSDVVISSDGQFALSGAWDGTLRLWDLTT